MPTPEPNHSDNKSQAESSGSNRRAFIQTTAGAVTLGSMLSTFPAGVHAQTSQKIRIALIGAGGRGQGAAADNQKAAGENTEIVAVADAFQGSAERVAKRYNVPFDKTFWGLDGYKKAIATDIDMVILATPPGFRPIHYRAAVEAGKHVFMEKPCCVDAPGYRSLLETNKMAEEKNLKVGVGLQRRHDKGYVNGIQQIHDGKWGDLVLLQAYWNGGGIWWRDGEPDWSEIQKQVNNWYHFTWLSGDNICEQHIHNIDVCNWAKNAHPVEANGMGGSEVRRREFRETQLFDHHFVEFTYPDGTKMYSQCRHAPDCFNKVDEYCYGTKGHGNMQAGGDVKDRNGVEFKFGNPYEQEHYALIQAILNDKPFHEGHYGATSSFTSVLGRYATYSGKVIKWDEAVAKGADLAPGLADYTWESDAPVRPDADGNYPIPMPGRFDPYA